MHSNHTILVRKKRARHARATFFNHLATDCIVRSFRIQTSLMRDWKVVLQNLVHGSLLALSLKQIRQPRTFLEEGFPTDPSFSDPSCSTREATINLHSFCKRSKLPFTTTSHLPLRNDSGTVKRFTRPLPTCRDPNLKAPNGRKSHLFCKACTLWRSAHFEM
jgi:hypothetical protein